MIRFPWHQPIVDDKRAGFKVDLRIGFFKVESRWKLLFFQRKRRLDETGDSRRCIQVPDVRLDRSDPAESSLLGLRSKCTGQRRQFNGIAQVGARAVRFDIADRIRIDIGTRQRLDDRGRLCRHARSSVV